MIVSTVICIVNGLPYFYPQQILCDLGQAEVGSYARHPRRIFKGSLIKNSTNQLYDRRHSWQGHSVTALKR